MCRLLHVSDADGAPRDADRQLQARKDTESEAGPLVPGWAHLCRERSGEGALGLRPFGERATGAEGEALESIGDAHLTLGIRMDPVGEGGDVVGAEEIEPADQEDVVVAVLPSGGDDPLEELADPGERQ